MLSDKMREMEVKVMEMDEKKEQDMLQKILKKAEKEKKMRDMRDKEEQKKKEWKQKKISTIRGTKIVQCSLERLKVDTNKVLFSYFIFYLNCSM